MACLHRRVLAATYARDESIRYHLVSSNGSVLAGGINSIVAELLNLAVTLSFLWLMSNSTPTSLMCFVWLCWLYFVLFLGVIRVLLQSYLCYGIYLLSYWELKTPTTVVPSPEEVMHYTKLDKLCTFMPSPRFLSVLLNNLV